MYFNSSAAKKPKTEPWIGEDNLVIKEEEDINGADSVDKPASHSSRNYRGVRKATPSHPGKPAER